MMKDYNRWTDKEHKYKGCVDCTYRNCQYCDDIVDYEKEAYNRLCDLEDKIENGTLVELPCKVGDIVYSIVLGQMWERGRVDVIEVYDNNVYLVIEDDVDRISTNEIGGTIFLTKAEAEAKLRELKGERQ